jgi:hypothetical protein
VLPYLDGLIDALSIRDSTEVRRLLAHPLARTLPAAVREEAEMLAQDRCDALTVPLRTMQLRHQTAELLREVPPVADVAEQAAPVEVADAPRTRPSHAPARAHRGARLVQKELPLSA